MTFRSHSADEGMQEICRNHRAYKGHGISSDVIDTQAIWRALALPPAPPVQACRGACRGRHGLNW
jgi:hypothetical protein